MTTTTTKEQGRIVAPGMGGFLNPPTHPEHTLHVETDLRKRKENRGGMSLEAAAECEWLDDATRAEARRVLSEWNRPPLESPEVQAWTRQVLGYFRNCYKGEGPEPECWHAGNLRIVKAGEPQGITDDHAGVRMIRLYYPEFTPTDAHFTEARWGNA